MQNTSLEQEIVSQLGKLSIEKQEEVLRFVQTLMPTPRRGIAGKELLRFAGAIEAGDLSLMAAAIEEGCEKVNADEW